MVILYFNTKSTFLVDKNNKDKLTTNSSTIVPKVQLSLFLLSTTPKNQIVNNNWSRIKKEDLILSSIKISNHNRHQYRNNYRINKISKKLKKKSTHPTIPVKNIKYENELSLKIPTEVFLKNNQNINTIQSKPKISITNAQLQKISHKKEKINDGLIKSSDLFDSHSAENSDKNEVIW